jgi:hypothetical protein
MTGTTEDAKAQAKLMRSLHVMNDALYLAVRRTGDAAHDAEEIEGELAEVLAEIHAKLAESSRILDELLADLQVY